MAVCESSGSLCTKNGAGGIADGAVFGKSSGGAAPKPKSLAVLISASAPMSRPMRAYAVLQETRRTSKRLPPHTSPPKLLIDDVVCGGVNFCSVGYTG